LTDTIFLLHVAIQHEDIRPRHWGAIFVLDPWGHPYIAVKQGTGARVDLLPFGFKATGIVVIIAVGIAGPEDLHPEIRIAVTYAK
jgi:hypothetical protein